MSLTRISYTKSWENPADFPTIETSEPQVRSDLQELPNQIRDQVNALISELEALGVLSAVQYGTADIKFIRLGADNNIEVSEDGVTWVQTAAGGHIIYDKDGNQIAQRSRLKFAGETTVEDDGTYTIVHGIKGDKGDKGDTGDVGPQGIKGDKGDRGLAWYPALDSLGNMTFTLEDTETPPPSYNIRGPQGPQGVQGVQGATGPAGAQGIQGPQGVQGPQGEQGETGPTGPQGPTGATGPQGPTGATGPQGATGPAGAQGATGPQGPTGPQGLKGDDGADGRDFKVLGLYATLAALQVAHPTGEGGDAYAVGTSTNNTIYIWGVDTEEWTDIGALQGPQGPQGPTGATGPTGPQGSTGARGPQGIQGIQGEKGDKGDAGATGATGAQGPQGIQGIQGEQGPRGPQGETGAQGPQGQAGQSAYTAAQSAGYTGTEAQFSSDLAAISGKASKKVPATAGNLATLLSTGELGDSGVQTSALQSKINASGILKGNGSGGVSAAVAGTDYIGSTSISAQNLVNTETTPSENNQINWTYA